MARLRASERQLEMSVVDLNADKVGVVWCREGRCGVGVVHFEGEEPSWHMLDVVLHAWHMLYMAYVVHGICWMLYSLDAGEALEGGGGSGGILYLLPSHPRLPPSRVAGRSPGMPWSGVGVLWVARWQGAMRATWACLWVSHGGHTGVTQGVTRACLEAQPCLVAAAALAGQGWASRRARVTALAGQAAALEDRKLVTEARVRAQIGEASCCLGGPNTNPTRNAVTS